MSETKRGFIMNRTMTKNICLVAAFFITAILAVLMMGNNAGATASAASAEFEFVVREIEEPEDEIYLDADQIALLQEGDIAVDWYINYSESVKPTIGVVFNYDSNNFTYIPDDDDDFLYAPGLGFVYSTAKNDETHELAVTAATGGSTTGGRFVTIYFRKISNSSTATMPIVSVIIDKINDNRTNPPTPIVIPVPYDTPAGPVLIGDINGNGEIDADDATALLQAMSGISTITEAQWATYSSRFPNVVRFAQADANQDDAITSADANEILSYYSHILIGNYNGSVGNYTL